LETLKEIAPDVERIALIYNPQMRVNWMNVDEKS